MPDTHYAKASMRRRLREQRRSIDPAQQSRAAASLPEQVQRLPQWSEARRIALYLCTDGEIDPAPLASLARNQGKTVFLPAIASPINASPDNTLSDNTPPNNTPQDHMAFAHWREGDTLVENHFAILEPPDDAPRCNPAEIDIVFLPLVAWDRRGGRLGMGGGFYDRALATTRDVLFVGLAHGLQEVSEVPVEPTDVRLHYVATGSALIKCLGK